MGDRANIFFKNGDGGIGVYGHWAGQAMAGAAAQVLKSKAFKARLGDPNYAMRIGVQIVLEALGAESTSETGCGLWEPAGGPDDNEYPFIVIDVLDGSVFVADDWRHPKPKEEVARPTEAAIAKRMDRGGEDDS
jgi:hypothetical protein